MLDSAAVAAGLVADILTVLGLGFCSWKAHQLVVLSSKQSQSGSGGMQAGRDINVTTTDAGVMTTPDGGPVFKKGTEE